MSVHPVSTRRHIPEHGFLHSHRRENLNSYKQIHGLQPEQPRLSQKTKGERGKKTETTAGRLKCETVVRNSEEVKVLGLSLHAALKWKQWVTEAARKTAGAIGILIWLRPMVGSGPLILLRLYKSLVRARIEYGSFLIHGLSNSQKALIEKIQLKANKIAL
jgi:hypothetical protein